MVRKTRNKHKNSNKNHRRKNKTRSKQHKKKYKRRSTKRTNKKKQIGGFFDVLGIGLGALASIAAIAFAGYKYTSIVEDKDIVELLLNNTANIEYLPKYSIIAHSIKGKNNKTGEYDNTYIDRYLKCVSNSELIEFIRENPDLLKTSTIKSIIIVPKYLHIISFTTHHFRYNWN